MAADSGPSREVAASKAERLDPTEGAPGELLPEAFYLRDAITVARELVGAVLVRGEVAVRITEVEAYVWPDDTASHARSGRTPRNAPMWGPPGRAYIYLCYGLHQMLNVVTNPEGEAAAVLVRAGAPLAGLSTLSARRGGRSGPVLLTGPGKIGAALALDRSFCHHPLFEPGGLELRRGAPPPRLAAGPRVGIDYAAPEHRDARWRYAWPGTPWTTQRRTLELERGPARPER